MLAHLVSLENEDPVATYKTVRAELAAYDKVLAEKRELLILTKTDMVTPERLEEVKKAIQKLNPEIFAITILDDEIMKTFRDDLMKILREVSA